MDVKKSLKDAVTLYGNVIGTMWVCALAPAGMSYASIKYLNENCNSGEINPVFMFISVAGTAISPITFPMSIGLSLLATTATATLALSSPIGLPITAGYNLLKQNTTLSSEQKIALRQQTPFTRHRPP